MEKKLVSPKLPTVKYLENKVWELCKKITRLRYGDSCISCGKKATGKSLHTGHLFRKKFLPFQMKYDLRLLRPQDVYCNLRLKGNEAWYAVNLIRAEGPEYFLDIAEDIELYKGEQLDTKQKRGFLQNLIARYQGIYETESKVFPSSE